MSKHKSEVKLYVAASVMIYARAPVKHIVETKSNNMSKRYSSMSYHVSQQSSNYIAKDPPTILSAFILYVGIQDTYQNMSAITCP